MIHLKRTTTSLKNKSHQFRDTLHQEKNITFDQINLNTTNNNDTFVARTTSSHGDMLSPIGGDVNDIMSKDDNNKVSHPSKNNDARRLLLEEKKVMLQHHLQLVPMEDKPLDSMMLKSKRYLICVLVPIGVGMIGAFMIVCTVVTLRKVARKRLVRTPLDDDAEAETSIASHISSISTESTDKVFLLHTDEI